MDFIRNMRNNNENSIENTTEKENEENINQTKENEDPILSTQEMISDARARRIQKNSIFKCDMCDFKSTSKTLLKNHKTAIHEEKQYPCNICEIQLQDKRKCKPY